MTGGMTNLNGGVSITVLEILKNNCSSVKNKKARLRLLYSQCSPNFLSCDTLNLN